MAQVLGIYIHIPFCRSKCDYCDFYSLPGSEEVMNLYQKALLTHIRLVAPQLRGYQVDSIYFGGGTPSYYGERRLRELLGSLQRSLTVSRAAEITLESNPDSVEMRSMQRLRKAGFNRVSLGMQTGDPLELCALHRAHSVAQVEQAVEIIREAKFDNLSLDLIYGLPGQDLESWKRTVEKAIALQPEHISAYGLKVEEGTPLYQRVQAGEELPDDDMQADMYLWAVGQLAQAGYGQYEISNFAKAGRESRHNLKYWMDREYIGLGPGAHSCFAGRRYAYPKDLAGYVDGMGQARLPLEGEEDRSKTERAREYLMLRLRTVRGIEEWEYRREFFMNFDPIEQKLEQFERQGWAVQSDQRWHFTPEGFLLSNQLIQELLEVQGDSPKIDISEGSGCFRFWEKQC